jgi:polygalacturonase
MQPEHQGEKMAVRFNRFRRDFLVGAGSLAAVGTTNTLFGMQSTKGSTPKVQENPDRQLVLSDAGAVGDSVTLNTTVIQSAIDKLAIKGGTLVVPKGVFLSGALFFRPGVHLFIERGGTLKGSTDTRDYPLRKTRVEGHFEEWLPALVNADGCDGLRIEGSGTLDGSGAPFWSEFWRRHGADPKTKNLDVLRPRIALIENSHNVLISDVTFKDSAYWNLHLYRCQDVLVNAVRFQVPDGVKCPSTDGTDIDSCQRVTIRGCTYRVDDDCVCLKGSKGPFAMSDKDSPAVEHIHVENTTFERGHGVVTLGSEATVVRHVIVERCEISGKIPLVRLKLRPDTPQLYENVRYRDLSLTGTGSGLKAELFDVRPWKQYFDLQGQVPPKSVVRNISLMNIKGTYGSLGEIQGNPGQTELTGFSIENVNLQVHDTTLRIGKDVDLVIKNAKVNGHALEASR